MEQLTLCVKLNPMKPWKGSEEGKGRKLLPSTGYQLNKQGPAGVSRQESVLLGPLETVQMHSHLVLSFREARMLRYLSFKSCLSLAEGCC